MYFKKEVFLIVGLAKSGIACGKFLLSFGAKCYFYESNAIVKERNLDMVSSMGGIVIGDLELDSVLREITTLVLSPGVPIDNTIAKKAKSLPLPFSFSLPLPLSMCGRLWLFWARC